MMQIGLASVYDKLGDSEKRDSYLNLAEKRIKLLESREERYSEYILEHFFLLLYCKESNSSVCGKASGCFECFIEIERAF